MTRPRPEAPGGAAGGITTARPRLLVATRSRHKLGELREAGMRVAIDDFGTGYSSLRRLARLPIDTLKIDRSFVSGMGGRDDNAQIVGVIVTLAHNLGLEVIAEGVETPEQLAMLRDLRCGQVQGYLFSRPVAADEVPGLLAAAAAAN